MKNKKQTARMPDRHRRAVVACLASIFAAPSGASAAPWEFGITADAGVAHSDNVFLAPEGSEESDTVYTLAPEFTLETDGDRLQAAIVYRPEGYFYSDFNDADDVYHVADAQLTTQVVSDRLYLYLSGVHFQSLRTPEAAIPTTNLPVSGNRVNSTILEARPYWQQQVGGADLLVEVGVRDLEYDDDDFALPGGGNLIANQSTTEKYGSLSVDNFSRQEGLAWGLNYNYRRMEYEIATPFEFERASVNLGFWLNNSLRLFGVGGAETSFDNLFEANLDEDFWEAGFSYRPNERLQLEVAAGERSYGSSLRGSLDFELRRGTLSLSYDESPTSRADTIFGVRPVDGGTFESLLERAGNADRFVRKRGEFSANIELAKSRFSLRVFAEERDGRTDETGNPLDDESLSGFSAGWDWAVGSRTSIDIGVDVARRDSGQADDDLIRSVLGVEYDLSARTALRIEGSRAEQDGNEALTFINYTENQARLTLQVEFL